MVVCEICGRTMRYSREDALYTCRFCKTEDSGEGEYVEFPSQEQQLETLRYNYHDDDNYVPEEYDEED